uniref:Uncharacterized protein n=1 Tax=Anguilla anguilla TaxID=7936 RepID=A0A0E9VN53_ANGAN
MLIVLLTTTSNRAHSGGYNPAKTLCRGKPTFLKTDRINNKSFSAFCQCNLSHITKPY